MPMSISSMYKNSSIWFTVMVETFTYAICLKNQLVRIIIIHRLETYSSM